VSRRAQNPELSGRDWHHTLTVVSAARRLFSFPNPVNETSARVVAGGVVAMSIAFLVTGWGWLLLPLTYGFWARVLTGPTLSPLGRLATQVVTPRLHVEHRFVPGPPKRFAQAIGTLFTTAASIAWLAGVHPLSYVLIAGLTVAASLEAFAAVCLGCIAFNRLMRWGLIPADVCEECADLSTRLAAGSAASTSR
jgi:hypothetical protein